MPSSLCGGSVLPTKASAPADSADCFSSGRAHMATIRIPGQMVRTAGSNSVASRPGRSQSRMITSGLVRSTCIMTSALFEASAETTIPGSCSSISLSAERTFRLPSATRTRRTSASWPSPLVIYKSPHSQRVAPWRHSLGSRPGRRQRRQYGFGLASRPGLCLATWPWRKGRSR